MNCVKFSNFDRFCNQNMSIMSANCFSFWGMNLMKPPDSLPGLRPWTPLRNLRPQTSVPQMKIPGANTWKARQYNYDSNNEWTPPCSVYIGLYTLEYRIMWTYLQPAWMQTRSLRCSVHRSAQTTKCDESRNLTVRKSDDVSNHSSATLDTSRRGNRQAVI